MYIMHICSNWAADVAVEDRVPFHAPELIRFGLGAKHRDISSNSLQKLLLGVSHLQNLRLGDDYG